MLAEGPARDVTDHHLAVVKYIRTTPTADETFERGYIHNEPITPGNVLRRYSQSCEGCVGKDQSREVEAEKWYTAISVGKL
jgi:hypothetical protein